jgi:hypothetical protein
LATEATEPKMKADRDQDSTAERERQRETEREDKKMANCRLMRDHTSKNEKNEGAMGGDLVLCFLYLVLAS